MTQIVWSAGLAAIRCGKAPITLTSHSDWSTIGARSECFPGAGTPGTHPLAPDPDPPTRDPEPVPDAVRESKVTIKIPRPLYRKIQQVVDGSGFASPTDFVVYVLRDLIGDAEVTEPNEFTQEELDDVKRKLKNLGYL